MADNGRPCQTVDKAALGYKSQSHISFIKRIASKIVFLCSFLVSSNPHFTFIFANFFKFIHANVSPTFISIRAFPTSVYIENHDSPLLFQRVFLWFLFSEHINPSFPMSDGCLHRFPCMLPIYAGLLFLHDPWSQYTVKDTGIVHRLLRSFYIPYIHPCLLYDMSAPDCWDRYNNLLRRQIHSCTPLCETIHFQDQ